MLVREPGQDLVSVKIDQRRDNSQREIVPSVLKSGTTGTVLDSDGKAIRIRVDNGPYKGEIAEVAPSFVVKER